MVDMLWSVLASGVDVPAAIGHIVPPGFAFVGEQNICAVVPSEPPVHALRQVPNILWRGSLVNPVGERPMELIRMCGNLFGELSVEAWEHIVKWERICAQVNPARICREDR